MGPEGTQVAPSLKRSVDRETEMVFKNNNYLKTQPEDEITRVINDESLRHTGVRGGLQDVIQIGDQKVLGLVSLQKS